MKKAVLSVNPKKITNQKGSDINILVIVRSHLESVGRKRLLKLMIPRILLKIIQKQSFHIFSTTLMLFKK
jgi:hypothetical protein